jgi:hypothetical protein
MNYLKPIQFGTVPGNVIELTEDGNRTQPEERSIPDKWEKVGLKS